MFCSRCKGMQRLSCNTERRGLCDRSTPSISEGLLAQRLRKAVMPKTCFRDATCNAQHRSNQLSPCPPLLWRPAGAGGPRCRIATLPQYPSQNLECGQDSRAHTQTLVCIGFAVAGGTSYSDGASRIGRDDSLRTLQACPSLSILVWLALLVGFTSSGEDLQRSH